MNTTLIVALFSILSSAVAVFALFTKNTDYKSIVNHYAREISNMKKETTKITKKLEEEVMLTIEKIEEVAIIASEKSISKIEENTKAKELIDMLSILSKNQKELYEKQKEIHELFNIYLKNAEEIKKRDAIISRLKRSKK